MADPQSLEQPRRRALKLAVSAQCVDIGFHATDEASLETLTEMLQSCKLAIFSYKFSNILRH